MEEKNRGILCLHYPSVLFHASDACEDADEQRDIFRVLSSLYMYSPEDAVKRLPYRGCYYWFLSFYILDPDCSPSWMSTIRNYINTNNLDITMLDLDEWKNPQCTIDDWLDRKGIIE